MFVVGISSAAPVVAKLTNRRRVTMGYQHASADRARLAICRALWPAEPSTPHHFLPVTRKASRPMLGNMDPASALAKGISAGQSSAKCGPLLCRLTHSRGNATSN